MIKLNLDHGAIFTDKMHPDLPPEIETIFLDSVINFEKAYQNVKQISVFEKLGEPELKLAKTLADDKITIELNRIIDLMRQNGLELDVLASYEDEN